MVEKKLPLLGFGISGFRSFGPEPQLIGPLKKINVIIGENNSGKSNISRYVRKVLPNPGKAITKDDIPQGGAVSAAPIPMLLEINENFWKRFLEKADSAQTREISTTFFRGLRFAQNAPKDCLWIECTHERSGGASNNAWMLHTKDWSEQTAKTGIYQLWKLISQSSGGDFREHWIPTLLQRLDGIAASRPKTHLVSAARKLETRIKDFSDEYGYHETEANPVINKLAQYSNPDYGNFKDKAKFEKIQEFVRGVMNDNSIRIEIPASKNTINVEQHGRFLPIEALGTGVFQAILLAAEATIHENAVVCIEEPELHLHPEVQRQVMTYLATETSNQYFISTHSAHIMDAVVDSCVIGVHIEDRWSVVHHPINSQQKRNICHRLGYRPSDLLQANCLIWIEGPSDRIYINHWLRAHDPKLVEGLHYSFSLYGGRVLSNFTSDEDAEDDLIEILPVNRFPAIVMDSDRKAVTDGINSTKGRIKVEVEKIGGLVWITDGREIENYVPWKMRDAAIKNTHKVKSLEKSEAEESKFDPPLNYFDHKDVFKDDGFNKNRIALSVTANAADLSVLDLADRIKELVEFINRANRLS